MEEIYIEMNNVKYKIKKNYKSLLIFEEISGMNAFVTNKSIKNILMLFYSIVKANNKIEFDFDEFVDIIDENPESVELFTTYIYKDVVNEVDKTDDVKKKRNPSK